jgi:hypothetical protein
MMDGGRELRVEKQEPGIPLVGDGGGVEECVEEVDGAMLCRAECGGRRRDKPR